MRRPEAMLLPVVILMGCSEMSLPTDAQRMASSASIEASKGPEHAGAIIGHDACDPASFNAVLGEGACVKPGPTTFDAFINELATTQTARAWRFNPLQATARAGVSVLVKNVGGEVHTFTPVAEFGGGFIPELNGISGNPVPAPECLDFGTMVFVPSGGTSVISAAELAAVADADGIAKIECCLHPWMRSVVRIK